MRLAWFSPWPPQPSGIAGRSAEVVPRLAAAGHGIDVFVDEREVRVPAGSCDDAPAPGTVRIQSAHDFVWRATRSHYNLVVYQIGNSRLHDFIWPYTFRWPGLAVFHDARLHHARGRALVTDTRAAAYRAEFREHHPDVPADATELAVNGFDGAYYYLWPMVGRIITTSHMVAAHSRGVVAELAERFPGHHIEYLPLGEGSEQVASDGERDERRSAMGLLPDAVTFGVFGALTAEKRLPQVLRAFHAVHANDPRTRLILAGRVDEHLGLRNLVTTLGLAEAVRVLLDLNDDAFNETIGAVDVVVNLRWPTALETSGPWLRALAAGRPAIVIDLAHQAHVPALDPRTWQPYQTGDGRAPVMVAVDILDEDHSLGLAMRRLASDAPLRGRLGRAARAYWVAEHTLDRMVEGYDSILRRAAAYPAPARSAQDLDAARTALLAPFGELTCALF